MKPIEYFLDNRNFSIVFEYLKGEQILSKAKNFTPKIIQSLMIQLLSALSYCHKKKIVHRYYYISDIIEEYT